MSSQHRRLSVAVCASQDESSIGGLMELLHSKEMKDAIESVEFVEMPYNGIDSFRFDHPIDVLILVHSINNRRFAITDVMDALYDKFLPMAKKNVGRDKIAVVVHDLPYPANQSDRDQRMQTFRTHQPLTFTCASLAVTCGKLSSGQAPQIADSDMVQLKEFLEKARHCEKVLPTQVGNDLWTSVIICVIAGVALLLYKWIVSLKGYLVSDGETVANISDVNLETEL